MALVYCRGCGKQIDEGASFCPHCGVTQHPEGSRVSIGSTSTAADYGMWLLAIPVIATALIWIVARGIHLPQTAADPIAIILYVAIGLTAIIAAVEANKVGMTSDRSKGSYGPIAWLIIIGLLWIIGYPMYLYKRRHYGLQNKLVPGIVIALILLGSAFAADWYKPAAAEQQNGLGIETSATSPTATTSASGSDQAFNCADDPDLPKSVDKNITVVEQIRPMTKEETDAAKVFHMVKNGMLEAIGQGDSSPGQYVLSQKIPGKILGICVGEAFYHEGDSHMIIFTVSEASNGDNYVAVQDYSEMQGALIVYRAGKEKQEQEAKLKAAQTQLQPISEGKLQQETPPAPAEPMKTAQETATTEPVKPSFDCNKATSKIDKLICQTPELAKWDKRLAESFNDRYSHASPQEKTELVTSQKEWVKKRNLCDSNKCIADVYQQRDEELEPDEYEQGE